MMGEEKYTAKTLSALQAAQQTAASAGIRRAHCRAAASRCFMACPSFVPVIVNGESRGSCREMAKEFDFRTLVFSAAIW